ncbi:hypothetical protein OIU76_007008 [Salix suchowensis]|nr:hypothetical protein OIU76_007008 [Salix suchowensis]
MGFMHNSDQNISMTDYNKGDRGKNSVSDEDEPSYTEEGADGHNDAIIGKKGTPWQRVKWTDKMARTGTSDCGGGMRRKFTVLQKKGKWKSVSKVMAERGFHVSPQQCEDKFNDLNKRLHLPHDPALQRSLQLALRSRDDHDNDDARRHPHDDLDEDDQEIETDDRDEFEENHASHGGCRGIHGDPNKGSCYYHPQAAQVDMNQVSSESSRAVRLQKQWMESRTLQLEEQKLQIQQEMLELEKQRFKWQRFSKKRDRELEKSRMENERMKLENEQMALELKRKEMGAGFN